MTEEGRDRERVLVALLVYDGRAFVPRAVESLAAMARTSTSHVDVVAFDDASPDPGWSEELERICRVHGVGYYRSPRNLGIPRNMSLAMAHAEAGGYDHVVLQNSDVIVPSNLADAIVAIARTDARIASVTAWSNNASIYSLPNDGVDAVTGESVLADQAVVDAIALTLADEFADEAVTIPVGMGFCLSIRVAAIADVGFMDPVFGRGYCEEVDWCRRAIARGWTHALARNTFVFHMGSATTRLAGLLAPGEHTVQVNERIIDERHPTYRDDVAAWEATGSLEADIDRAARRLVRDQARGDGYVLEATWLRRRVEHALGANRVRITVNPDGPRALVEAEGTGFRVPVPVGPDGILAAVAAFVGVAPAEIRLLDHGSQAARLADDAAAQGIALVRPAARYPARV